MLSRSTLCLIALSVGIASANPVAAQGNDPLTRYLNGLFNQDKAATEKRDDKGRKARAKASRSASTARAKAQVSKKAVQPAPPSAEQTAAIPQEPVLPEVPAIGLTGLEAAPPAARPAALPAVASALPIIPVAAQQQPALPTTPAAALDRLNAYFNSIDVLTASFTQTSNGQKSQGSLQLKRPGQLRFAYAPPSTLEIVSDGRSVAIRDKKLGTNDVYPIGQTPLKFLLQEQFDIARDTKVRNVQTNPDGTIVVRFDDSATFGGTSKVTLQFDARRNRLKEWTVVDPQGYETHVVLSDVEAVIR